MTKYVGRYLCCRGVVTFRGSQTSTSNIITEFDKHLFWVSSMSQSRKYMRILLISTFTCKSLNQQSSFLMKPIIYISLYQLMNEKFSYVLSVVSKKILLSYNLEKLNYPTCTLIE